LKAIVDSFISRFGILPEVVVRAPGRVNLLGAHVDYNEGWVLPGAIDRAVWVAAGPRTDSKLQIESLDLGGQLKADLDSFAPKHDEESNAGKRPGWSKFPLGVAWVLAGEGKRLPGMNAVFSGNIPIGAGVSSSAAVEIAFIMAWESIADFTISGQKRAELGQRVENEYLGVSSGIMDQYASVHGKADNLILLDCRSIDHRLVPLPAGTGIIIADSGVRRELANSEYNLRREQCQQAVAILRQDLPDVMALRDVTMKDFRHLSNKLPRPLRMRAQHVIEECARVLEGVQALESGNLNRFGDAITRSHISSRDLYEVSIEELDILAEAAWDTPGCYGARLTGAGFGGCVVAFIDQNAGEEVTQAMRVAFSRHFGREPSIFTAKVDDGASFHSLPDF
jgi:galactokinase